MGRTELVVQRRGSAQCLHVLKDRSELAWGAVSQEVSGYGFLLLAISGLHRLGHGCEEIVILRSGDQRVEEGEKR